MLSPVFLLCMLGQHAWHALLIAGGMLPLQLLTGSTALCMQYEVLEKLPDVLNASSMSKCAYCACCAIHQDMFCVW